MQHLKQASLAGKYEGLKLHVEKVQYESPKLVGVPIEGHFFQICCRNNNEPMTEELAGFAYNKIIDFCIPRSRLRKDNEQYEKDHDTRHFLDIADRARNVLISSPSTLKKSGESGELLLFILLEGFLNAPLVANKMYLKTNNNMPVFGTDGIHMRIEDDSSLSLIWGESKLDQDYSDAARYACNSIAEFMSMNDGNQREAEIRIITEYCDLDNVQAKQSLVEYLDPYNEKHKKLQEKHACFIGFDFHACSKKMTEEDFLSAYKERIDTACELLAQKKISYELDDLEFIFLLLPFDSIAKFRRKFYSKLGITVD